LEGARHAEHTTFRLTGRGKSSLLPYFKKKTRYHGKRNKLLESVETRVLLGMSENAAAAPLFLLSLPLFPLLWRRLPTIRLASTQEDLQTTKESVGVYTQGHHCS
jgi:hypothetical protein